jgi:pyridoxal phosphate enzyme (YggS family)
MSNSILLIDRLQQLREQLAMSARQAHRGGNSVTLLAVSKQQPVAAIRTLATAGQRDFGESYAQEALPKMAMLTDLQLCWHFIGQLQGNKTRPVAEYFHWVHTVDRDKIASRLNEQRPAALPALQVCIQVKLGEEVGKGGVHPHQVLPLAQHIQQLPRLKLRGLMCIPPPATDPATQLQQFQQLAGLQQQLNAADLSLDTLSMGMSGDYAAAIAAGSTLVRIGTALFGERIYPHSDALEDLNNAE